MYKCERESAENVRVAVGQQQRATLRVRAGERERGRSGAKERVCSVEGEGMAMGNGNEQWQ